MSRNYKFKNAEGLYFVSFATVFWVEFWPQHNQPVELWRAEVIQQKIDYIHNNPVV